MVQQSEACIKRPKPLENVASRSEELESGDLHQGRGEREGGRQKLTKASGEGGRDQIRKDFKVASWESLALAQRQWGTLAREC